MDTIQVRLSQADSRKLIEMLEAQEHPWVLVYTGDMVFEVWIDGTQTVHTLNLDHSEGVWSMATVIPV